VCRAYRARAQLVVDGAHAGHVPTGPDGLGSLEQVHHATAKHHIPVVVALHGDLCDLDVGGVGERLDDPAAKRDVRQ